MPASLSGSPPKRQGKRPEVIGAPSPADTPLGRGHAPLAERGRQV